MTKKVRWVDLSAIPKEQKAEAWARLQEHHPEAAELVSSELVQECRRRFGARVLIWIETGDAT